MSYDSEITASTTGMPLQGYSGRAISWGGLERRLYSYAEQQEIAVSSCMGDTFTGLVEAFSCRTEQSKEVVEALVQETIPHFSLPEESRVTMYLPFGWQWHRESLRLWAMNLHWQWITQHLHCAWRPQSSGKVEKINKILKKHLHKLSQETHLPWTTLLPLAL